MSDDNLILTIACPDNEPSIMVAQSEYNRLVLIAKKAAAVVNAQCAIESALNELQEAFKA